MKLSLRKICTMLAVIFCLFVLTNLIMKFFETEEDRLKRVIHKAKRATERENIIGLRSYISADYDDEFENSRRSLLLLAKDLFDEYKNILITIDELDMEIDGEGATALINTTVYWQEDPPDKIMYDKIKLRAFFKKIDGRWKFTELKFFKPEKRLFFSPLIG
jgi:hypothetical protein